MSESDEVKVAYAQHKAIRVPDYSKCIRSWRSSIVLPTRLHGVLATTFTLTAGSIRKPWISSQPNWQRAYLSCSRISGEGIAPSLCMLR